MKKNQNHRISRIGVLIILLLLLNLFPFYAQKAFIADFHGTAKILSPSMASRPALNGGILSAGETVITDKNSVLTLWFQADNTITVGQNSVFGFHLVGSALDSRMVLTCHSGEIQFEIQTTADKPLYLSAPLFAISLCKAEGSLWTSRYGQTRLLLNDETVLYGREKSLFPDGKPEAPGLKESFETFESWNSTLRENFLSDPIGALGRLDKQFSVYQKIISDLQLQYTEATKKYISVLESFQTHLQTKDNDTIRAFRKKALFPAQDERAAIMALLQFQARSCLSLRRFALSGMYIEIKNRNLITDDPVDEEFFALFSSVLARFENITASELEISDY